MASSGEKRLVFVSHAGEDTWVARQIANEIEEQGAESFLDEANIDIGAEFEEDILASLNQADELLVLITPWALERPYVWVELGVAWFRQIPIVVVLYGVSIAKFQSNIYVPIFLKKRNLININDIDQYFGQLKNRIP